MKNTESKLAAAFLKAYAQDLGNRGCTDWKWPENFSQHEKSRILDQIHRRSITDMSLDDLENRYSGVYGPDSFIMAHYLAELIEEEV